MEKTTFTPREERISTKIIEILAKEEYFDPKSKLYKINEKILKEFFPGEASLDTIIDVTSRSPLFSYAAKNITLAQTIPALITYKIDGASSLKINGANARVNVVDTIPTKLVLPNYRFEITVTTPTTQAPWVFVASQILIPFGPPRKMSPATKQGRGAAIVLIDTV